MNKPSFSFLFFFWGWASLIVCPFDTAIAQEQNDSLAYYHNSIVNPKNSEEISRAFLFFENRIQEDLNNSDTLSLVQNLRRMAIGQFELGFYHDSEKSAVDALRLIEGKKGNDMTLEAKKGLNNHLGLVYRLLKSHKNALRHYEAALKLATDVSDSILILNNISNIFMDAGNYGSAVKNLTIVFGKSKTQNHSLNTALAQDNLGFAQSKMGLPEGLPNMRSALKIRESENDIPGLYSSHHHLSQYFLDEGNRQEAMKHAQKAYRLAQQLNSASYLENALSLLVDLSEDPRVITYKNLSDSISRARQVRENKYAAIKYDVEKERKKRQAAELQHAKQKNLKIIFLLAFLLAVLVGTFLVYRKNQQRSRERAEAVYRTEARISKKVHDELANDVSGVMTFVENHVDTPMDIKNKLLHFLNTIYTHARDISTTTASVDVANFPETLEDLIAQHHPKNVEIIRNPMTHIDWHKVPGYKKTAIFKSLQELLVNTKKHAKASTIGIVFKNKGKYNEIVYSDDGVGCDSQNIILGGLLNVETRMNEIGGNISFESSKGNGFKAILHF